MIQLIRDELLRVFKLPLQNDMIRFNISKDQWLQVEYKDRNSYAPSQDGYRWKTLCARNCYDSRGTNRDGDETYKYWDPKEISQWVVLILADKMLWFSQDVNGIQHDFDLIRKPIK